MLRYLRLYLYFLRFSFSRALEFRLDFFFRVGMDIVWYAVHLGFFSVLYQHTASLGGLTQDQVLVFVGAVFVAEALSVGLPLLVGLSRKSMIGELIGREVTQRLPASLGLAVLAVERGAAIIRTHDVAATHDAVAMWTALKEAGC